jgi:hypothetical protein
MAVKVIDPVAISPLRSQNDAYARIDGFAAGATPWLSNDPVRPSRQRRPMGLVYRSARPGTPNSVEYLPANFRSSRRARSLSTSCDRTPHKRDDAFRGEHLVDRREPDNINEHDGYSRRRTLFSPIRLSISTIWRERARQVGLFDLPAGCPHALRQYGALLHARGTFAERRRNGFARSRLSGVSTTPSQTCAILTVVDRLALPTIATPQRIMHVFKDRMIGLDALKEARRFAHDLIGHPPRHSLESRIHINNIWSRRVEIGSSHDDAFGRRIEYRCWVDPASIGSHV